MAHTLPGTLSSAHPSPASEHATRRPVTPRTEVFVAITPGTASSAAAKACIRVATTTGQNHEGRVTVYVDQGSGFQAATPKGTYYGKGATVLDECYANVKAVRMQNTANDGWIGLVLFARSRAGPHTAGVCTTCDNAGSSGDILFDGDDKRSNSARTHCSGGKMCDIRLPTIWGSSPVSAVTQALALPQ